jgi:peptidoglycan/LPS O-acetylase OafA/YrhL
MAAVGPENFVDELRTAPIALTQTTAFFQIADDPVTSGMLHLWSLTVEWCFYVMWPLILLIALRRQVSNRALIAGAGSLAVVLYLVSLPSAPLTFYVSPVANVSVMLLGACAALDHARRDVPRERRRSDLALALLLVIFITPSNLTGLPTYRYAYFPIAAMAAFVLIHQFVEGGLADRVLTWWPMVVTGRASYSLYLWHIPVLWIVWWSLPEASALFRVGLALASLVPVVWASYMLLVRPWLHTSPRPAPVSPTEVQPATSSAA